MFICYKFMDKLTFLNKLEKYFFTYDHDLIFFTEVELLRSQCRNALKEMIQFNEVDKRRHWIVIFREMINICNNYYRPDNKDLEIEVNGKTILLDHKYIISYEFYEFVLYLTKDESLKETVHLTITEIIRNIKNSLHTIKDMSSTYVLSELLLLVVGVKMSFTTEYLIIVINILESSIRENNFTFVNVHEITIHLKLIMHLVEDSTIKQNVKEKIASNYSYLYMYIFRRMCYSIRIRNLEKIWKICQK
ncbi:uncharacterized protein TA14335 [Theileria annulata]|uniref:Uncharacterized protein n=1 Tax=Theileria annulata TaxID=5874 RepID=Q4UF01_THEAN|nr:uncharacterized protein TA14335 [Theileria annulata]CAI74338.1 hypothetical protein TA14335 [Theileria annulata]|eukprot:XP_952070.1 hypothetical protein TA14335 [Theileria annulata]